MSDTETMSDGETVVAEGTLIWGKAPSAHPKTTNTLTVPKGGPGNGARPETMPKATSEREEPPKIPYANKVDTTPQAPYKSPSEFKLASNATTKKHASRVGQPNYPTSADNPVSSLEDRIGTLEDRVRALEDKVRTLEDENEGERKGTHKKFEYLQDHLISLSKCMGENADYVDERLEEEIAKLRTRTHSSIQDTAVSLEVRISGLGKRRRLGTT